MSEVCPKCGLPKELCVCETIAKEEQKITINVVKRRFGKLITQVTGIDEKDINIKDLAKKLKSKLACGGTAKDGKIELQGNHADKVKEFLVEQGFSAGTIVVKKQSFGKKR
ncbi:stress response translation initiation inhibitor YciH [archaeon]|nr:stress response translation initiation inhibitor YciH [archaeon]|tara:strand:+ start:1269 stop:1601 length:333 start_codon:yes stop_codon:yes gene_type:complete